jgi:hypothetical protein
MKNDVYSLFVSHLIPKLSHFLYFELWFLISVVLSIWEGWECSSWHSPDALVLYTSLYMFNKHNLYCSKFVLIMTRFPANLLYWMSSIISAAVHFRYREKLDHISLARKTLHTRLACEVEHASDRRRNIHIWYLLHRLIVQTVFINERYDMVVYSWNVSCPIFKTKDLFYNGILWFPNWSTEHRQLCI